MWVFDTSSEYILDPPATNYSTPYILPVGASLDIYMSPEQKIMGDVKWLRYTFGMFKHLFLPRDHGPYSPAEDDDEEPVKGDEYTTEFADDS